MGNLSRSGYINHTMLGLRVTMARKVAGLEPISLRGYTIRSLKIIDVEEQGKGNWRAMCNKCHGRGHLNPENDFVRDDINGRGYICFGCQGRGWFLLPKPEVYRDVVALWVLEAHFRGLDDQIVRVMESELQFAGINQSYFSPVKELWTACLFRHLEGMDFVQEGDEIFERLLPIRERANQLDG